MNGQADRIIALASEIIFLASSRRGQRKEKKRGHRVIMYDTLNNRYGYGSCLELVDATIEQVCANRLERLKSQITRSKFYALRQNETQQVAAFFSVVYLC